ncbi:MAG: chemotaxis protein CheA [Planctomycetota bacterium]|nr:chemotaxis protein CheA [Planctomycetota bacterium]
MPIDVSQFRGMFFEEARDYVAAFEQAVLQLEKDPSDKASVQEMFRAAHSLKGCSSTLGVNDVAAFTHVLENLLDHMRERSVAVSAELIELLLASSDMLGDLLQRAREGQEPPPGMEPLVHKLAAHVRVQDDAPAEVSHGEDQGTLRGDGRMALEIRCEPNLLTEGLDPLPLLRELYEVAEVESLEADVSRVPDLDALEPERCYLAWSGVVDLEDGPEAVREIFEFVEDTCHVTLAPIEAKAPAASSADETAEALIQKSAGLDRTAGEKATLRVATERIDEMINLVGELVIAQASLAQTAGGLEADEAIAESIERMGRRLRELQQCALSVRTIPLSTVFFRFPRLVRDLAAELGKQVQLEVVGGETELDKGVIEGLAGPLTHLVRNAMDHGLETPEAREAAGKPATGSIQLAARQEHGSVVIELSDDGRGLDTQRILEKARAAGLVGPNETVGSDRLHAMIFEPGFSTAASVSDVSGRGVGMDAARSAIEDLSGTLHVRSEPGRGTTVCVTLPLTLAILDGFALMVGRQTYVVPLLSVLEVVKPAREDFSTVLDRGELVSVRGDVMRLVRMRDVLGHPPALDDAEGLIVVVEVQGERFGLLVDDLEGQTNVVIKGLDESVKTSPAILGGSIQGDGSIAFILDLAGVVRVHLALRRTPALATPESESPSGI